LKISSIIERIEEILSQELEGLSFTDSYILGDNNQATIVSMTKIESFELESESLDTYGDGFFQILFEFFSECLLYSYLSKKDFMVLRDKEKRNIKISDYDDFHYKIEEHVKLRVIGDMSLSFDLSNITNAEQFIDNFDQLFDTVIIDVESFEVEVATTR
jgi:hypothetical protein